jgi:hypothetical protein
VRRHFYYFEEGATCQQVSAESNSLRCRFSDACPSATVKERGLSDLGLGALHSNGCSCCSKIVNERINFFLALHGVPCIKITIKSLWTIFGGMYWLTDSVVLMNVNC